MPLIRYDTKDLISNKKYHSEGNLPEYGKILGRKDDVIILKDGRKIGLLDIIFTTDLNISQGQIIQEDFSTFTINIVPALKWKKENENILRNNLMQRLGDVDINIQICDTIKKTWAGKFRVIKSNVDKMSIND